MKVLVQCGILFGVCVAGYIISVVSHWPIPGNVFSMVILFLLLYSGVLKKAQIKRISQFLLGNMAFFFIPSGVAIVADYRAIAKVMVPFLLIILATTIIVLGVTGQCAQWLQKLSDPTGKTGRSAENTLESRMSQ